LLTRRKFLKLGSAATAGVFLPWQFSLGCGSGPDEPATGSTPVLVPRLPANIDRFVDPLPLPPVLAPDTEKYEGSDYYEISISQFEQQLHSQLPATPVWGYGGSYPGPTIEARSGRPVRVRWINDSLPSTHLLRTAIDTTLFHGMEYPEVRTVTHLHGGHTPPRFDGQPEAWSTPAAGVKGPDYQAGDFIYPNGQRACTLWYHDHAMGITRLNVYAGLAGLYIIRDEIEDSLGLPRGDYEIPLVIQDRIFNPDGSLHYPTQGISPAHPVWNMNFFGDQAVVNGKVFPFLDVEPRRYRFRILNGSQSRFYNLWFDGPPAPIPFHVIGTDGGLLAQPAEVRKLLLAPAERADLLVDFSNLADGTVLTLKNDAAAPFPAGGGYVIGEIMQLRVSRPLDGDDETIPAVRLELPPVEALAATPGIPAREIVLTEHPFPAATMNPAMENPGGGGGPRAGFTELLINEKRFSDPVDEKPAVGTTEIWQFFNATADTHPMHIHLVQFQILNRQKLDAPGYFTVWDAWRTGAGPKPALNDYLIGPPIPPAPEESGWKDTARALPEEILRLIARFDLPPGTVLPARYIYHCHILEHEDNEMMRPFDVV
jgi:spore coat protein A